MNIDLLEKNLRRINKTLDEALDNPDEVLPVPSPPFPPGRDYYINGSVTLVVDRESMAVVATVPTAEARASASDQWLVTGDERRRSGKWAKRTIRFQIPATVVVGPGVKPETTGVQVFTDRNGVVWTAQRIDHEKVTVLRDGTIHAALSATEDDDDFQLESGSEDDIPDLVYDLAWETLRR